MSTPRQSYPNCPNCGEKAVCPKCGETATYQTPFDGVFWDSSAHYWKCKCSMKAPEGVAAPLEPTPHQFAHNWALSHEGVEQRLDWRIFELMKAYAAAVSKNLQEELARLKSEVAVRDEWLRFADAEDLQTYRELRMRAGKSPR